MKLKVALACLPSLRERHRGTVSRVTTAQVCDATKAWQWPNAC